VARLVAGALGRSAARLSGVKILSARSLHHPTILFTGRIKSPACLQRLMAVSETGAKWFPLFGTGSTPSIRWQTGSGNFTGIHHELDGIENAQNAPGSSTTTLLLKGQ
jgi:hypothetical protein